MRLLLVFSLLILPLTAWAAEQEASVQSLLSEAQELFSTGHSIDAREKLQQAVRLAPKDFRPHLMLGAYYLGEVGHFRLAYRYIETAEKLFYQRNGKDEKNYSPESWSQHARLLFLKSESLLNLDRYQASLDTLDDFSSRYWDEWLPGTRAWVLMKLRRNEEAIATAQNGLLRGAELGRTYNILGILLSLTGRRELSLDAFENAIRAEFISGRRAQIATPLNNAGEVYRELFRDREAEAAFTAALRFPDGCEHILPSLNLAVLQVDELRLLQADRTLSDFEACFAQNSQRSDTEHRTLLALMRGKIALRRGEPNLALKLIRQAAEQEQWFGKIGTNENDVRLSINIALADAYTAQANALNDHATPDFTGALKLRLQQLEYQLRAAWHAWKARQIGFEETEDFEDLSVRHTDAMLEYPTLGRILAGFPYSALKHRLQTLTTAEKRTLAKNFYRLWLLENALKNGEVEANVENIAQGLQATRRYDRLLRAEFLRAQWALTPDNKTACELFDLNPSALRYQDGKLPVALAQTDKSENAQTVRSLLASRFSTVSGCHYRLEIHTGTTAENLLLQLTDSNSGQILLSLEAAANSEKSRASLVNKFIAKAFQHRLDPPAEPLPQLPILQGIL